MWRWATMTPVLGDAEYERRADAVRDALAGAVAVA